MNSPSRIRRSRMSFEMNRVLQWKLIAGFLLVFIAGGITGAFVGGSYARHHFFELHHPERIAGRMKERLRAELNLTRNKSPRSHRSSTRQLPNYEIFGETPVDGFAVSSVMRIGRWLPSSLTNNVKS